MRKVIYAIRDTVAGDLVGYFPLVVFRTDAQAVRYLGDSLVTEKSALAAHPNDYELITCGTIEEDGKIHAFQEPKVVVTGAALVASQNMNLEVEK